MHYNKMYQQIIRGLITEMKIKKLIYVNVA